MLLDIDATVRAIRAAIDTPIDFYVEAPDNIGGFIRPEFAYSTSSKDNPATQLGNYFNGVSVDRQAYAPPAERALVVVPMVLDGGVGFAIQLGGTP